MRNAAKVILIAVLAALPLTAVLTADPQPKPLAVVDVAAQLKLRRELLQAMAKGSADKDKAELAKLLAHVEQEWESLTPDQQRRYGQQAMAFLSKSPEQQEELLRRYEKYIKMTAADRERYRQRADELAAVVRWLEKNDPERIEQLKKTTPMARARQFLELRDTLLREKKISLEAPTSRPAAESPPSSGEPASSATSRPTSAPAEEEPAQ